MKFDDFKITTRVRKLNLWLQIVLGVLLYVGLNYMAFRHYMRIDLSEAHKNSLSPESVAYIKNLNSPIDIHVVISTQNSSKENVEVIKFLRLFLVQYEYASIAPNKIKVNYVYSNVENRKADELVKKFGSGIENSVIVAGKMRSKIIPISEFIDEKNKKFKGETLMTSAILNVSKQKQPKIYFSRGHGELDYKSPHPISGLSEFALALQTCNYKLEDLELSTGQPFPEDADMVVIAAPMTSFLPREIEQLRRYLLKDNGRVVVFLPMGKVGGLEEIFYEWGLIARDMQILDISGDYESTEGDLIARTFPENPHSISKQLIAADTPVQFGSVRPVYQDLGAASDASLTLTPLIMSSKTSWAEGSYMRGGIQKYDESHDLLGPLPLAMMASRSGGKELKLNIPGGKLAVFGDENFIANKWFHRLGNSMMAMNTINWMLNEDDMLTIPPRNLKVYSLTVSHNDLVGLAIRFFMLPFAILALGMIVSIIRRN